MPLPQASADFYRSQQRLVVATLAATRREWSRMGLDFDASWQSVGPRLLTLVSAAQLGAARAGASYAGDVLDETGVDAPPEGAVQPRSLAGVASDGRLLESLLAESVVRAKSGVAAGMPPREALAGGGRFLDLATHTQVMDAGRVASGVAVAVRPKVGGYIREPSPSSCSRCIVLAGRFYRWNAGFERHLHCHCVHVPVESVNSPTAAERIDPDRYFQGLSAIDQDRLFGAANAQAIRDGADIARVVNATGRKSGVYTAGGRQYTRELRQPARPTPEHIYDVAQDRADAIRLLRVHGYVT